MSNPLNFQFDDFFGGLEDQIGSSYGQNVETEDMFEYVEQNDPFDPRFMDAPGSFYDLSSDPIVDNTYLRSSLTLPSSNQGSRDFFEAIPESFFEEPTVAERIQESVFGEEGALRALGLGAGAVRDIQGFLKGARKGIPKQAQGQGRGRIGPGLTTSTPRTSAAGRTSGARQTLSGQKSIERAIEQSRRATSAARAIANQMARAGTVTSTNDLADMISGATSPKGTKQALPGTRLRQLAIPRTA